MSEKLSFDEMMTLGIIRKKDKRTDLYKMKKLLSSFSVGFEEQVNKQYNAYPDDMLYNDVTILRCEEGDSKIGGYFTFYTLFVFDCDGKFIEMGAWE